MAFEHLSDEEVLRTVGPYGPAIVGDELYQRAEAIHRYRTSGLGLPEPRLEVRGAVAIVPATPQGIRMRFRTGCSAFAAEDAARFARGEPMLYHNSVEELEGAEPARPGDVWRTPWYKSGQGDGPDIIAGYTIGCPTCGCVHSWTIALNCATRTPDGYCIHMGKGSCWEWTGSAEDNLLTATPSLHCVKEKGGCGFHGWLTNGILRSC